MTSIRVCILAGLLALPLLASAQPRAVAHTEVTTLAGSASGKNKEAVDGAGASARFRWPMGIAVDDGGVVYVSDEESNTIRKITPAGSVSTLAGSAETKGSEDGAATAARFYHPVGLALDKEHNLYVTDAENQTIRKITPAGIVTTLAGVAEQKGSADGSAPQARFNYPHGVAVDATGTVYIADTYNHSIRKISLSGEVTTLAGLAGTKGSADGLGAQARFCRPAGIAVDAAGAVYVADNGNYTIRKISPAGLVTTLAGLPGKRGSANGMGAEARFDTPNGIAVGRDGTVYVADYLNSLIRQITPQGNVSLLAGLLKGWGSLDGPGPVARFKFPFGVAVGANGWVYVVDTGNHTIRIIN